MKYSAKFAVLCTTGFIMFGVSSAIADPTTGQPGAKAPAAPVFVPTSAISKVSAKYSTDTFFCSTTEQTLLSRQINNSTSGTVVVHFSAEIFGGGLLLLSLKRNGVVVPGPGDVTAPMGAHDSGDGISTNGFIWAVPNVPAGLQNFAVTCTSSVASQTVDEREIVIYHR